MKQVVRRTTGLTLALAVATVLLATPAAADPVTTAARATPESSLSTLSPASLQLVRAASAGARMQDSPMTPRTFFKTRKGALAIGLIAAGVGFTVWSINHDRKPVRSPIR